MSDIQANLEVLTYLQACDLRATDLRKRLESVPLDIQRLEGQIQALREELETKKHRLRELEVRRKEAENDIAASEAQIARYRNQQLTVKKNEEYRALEQEIATLQEKISGFETGQLELMMAIDQEQENVRLLSARADDEIGEIEDQIAGRRADAVKLESQLKEAKEALEAARGEAGERLIRQYEQVKRNLKRPPYITPLESGKCSGCHLRVSNDVATATRQLNELVRCDNCGRIVYHEA